MVKKIYKGHVKKIPLKVNLRKKMFYIPPLNTPIKILAYIKKSVLPTHPLLNTLKYHYIYPRTIINSNCNNPMIMN